MPQDEQHGTRLPEGMAGLAKGLAILEAFSASKGRMTVADAARASGTSRASARRCLLTLSELGYLEYDGKFFRPQPRVLSLASIYSVSRSLPVIAGPILAAARDALRESVSLATMDDGRALFVARAEAERLVLSGIAIGTRAPAYCSATGRVLLSGWDDAQVSDYLDRADLVARTNRTVTGKDALLAIVRTVRDQGHAVSNEELELGLLSVAVPVRDSRGNMAAAMSASASSARITLADLTGQFLPVLTQYAAQLGRSL